MVVFTYSHTVSVDTFLSDLNMHAEVSTGKFDHIGWIFHGFKNKSLVLFSDLELQAKDLLILSNEFELSTDIIRLLSGIKKLALLADPRIDLLACCLAEERDTFDRLSTYVKDATGVDLAASSDLTGNVTGANWILETHQINTTDLYFSDESLQKYAFTFSAIDDKTAMGDDARKMALLVMAGVSATIKHIYTRNQIVATDGKLRYKGVLDAYSLENTTNIRSISTIDWSTIIGATTPFDRWRQFLILHQKTIKLSEYIVLVGKGIDLICQSDRWLTQMYTAGNWSPSHIYGAEMNARHLESLRNIQLYWNVSTAMSYMDSVMKRIQSTHSYIDIMWNTEGASLPR